MTNKTENTTMENDIYTENFLSCEYIPLVCVGGHFRAYNRSGNGWECTKCLDQENANKAISEISKIAEQLQFDQNRRTPFLSLSANPRC